MSEPRTLRELWDSGTPMIGAWCAIPSAFTAEIIGLSGFDFVTIDTQHGLIDYTDMRAMLQALSRSGTRTLARVRWNEPGDIMKALDAGAHGVIVPMVNSPEQARIATEACRYPPHGIRSWGPTRASLDTPNFNPELSNHQVICVVMVETVDAVAHIDDILAVPGIDAVFIGPNDLAISAGLPPTSDPTDPEHQRLINTILKSCQAHGIIAGISCGNTELTRHWINEGFRMLAIPSDVALLRDSIDRLMTSLNRTTTTRHTDGYS
jgi:4-hydroxy-2-oxoheptanedioate aldolase